jgi:hypothetical protein
MAPAELKPAIATNDGAAAACTTRAAAGHPAAAEPDLRRLGTPPDAAPPMQDATTWGEARGQRRRPGLARRGTPATVEGRGRGGGGLGKGGRRRGPPRGTTRS